MCTVLLYIYIIGNAADPGRGTWCVFSGIIIFFFIYSIFFDLIRRQHVQRETIALAAHPPRRSSWSEMVMW